MYEIRKRKNNIREKYKKLRASLDPSAKARMDDAICQHFLSMATYRFASTLLMYAPKNDEVNIFPIAVQALADGKKVAFPRCIPAAHDMVYHYVTSLDQLKSGSYGLLEPTEDLPSYDRASKEVTACLVPALVYDKKGYRLGYGKGYYDRYLSSFTGSKVGLIYSDFMVDLLPRGRFDLAVDFIITERGLKV